LDFRQVGFDYEKYVKSDERFYRPVDVDLLIGDSTKARSSLGWQPRYTFQELVKEMVLSDLEAASGAQAGNRSKPYSSLS